MKAQPSTPLEVKEQRATTFIEAVAAVDSAVAEYKQLFEQSFEVLTSLQEDPNIEWLDTEVHDL